MPELERWVLHRLAELDHKVRKGYEAYDFQGVFKELFTFATVDLSSFYFDVRKDVLYCDGDTAERRAARTVLDILYHRLTTWLAPILVFHHGGGLAGAISWRRQLGASGRYARHTGRLAGRTAGGQMGRHPPRAPGW